MRSIGSSRDIVAQTSWPLFVLVPSPLSSARKWGDRAERRQVAKFVQFAARPLIGVPGMTCRPVSGSKPCSEPCESCQSPQRSPQGAGMMAHLGKSARQATSEGNLAMRIVVADAEFSLSQPSPITAVLVIRVSIGAMCLLACKHGPNHWLQRVGTDCQ